MNVALWFLGIIFGLMALDKILGWIGEARVYCKQHQRWMFKRVPSWIGYTLFTTLVVITWFLHKGVIVLGIWIFCIWAMMSSGSRTVEDDRFGGRFSDNNGGGY